MTLDELIAEAEQLRAEHGGRAEVFVMTPRRGYAPAMLTTSLGFADPAGEPETIVLVGPGQ
jgi:hypothetical protein